MSEKDVINSAFKIYEDMHKEKPKYVIFSSSEELIRPGNVKVVSMRLNQYKLSEQKKMLNEIQEK